MKERESQKRGAYLTWHGVRLQGNRSGSSPPPQPHPYQLCRRAHDPVVCSPIIIAAPSAATSHSRRSPPNLSSSSVGMWSPPLHSIEENKPLFGRVLLGVDWLEGGRV
ncbi:unnamed protein product [Boreogadus saida]